MLILVSVVNTEDDDTERMIENDTEDDNTKDDDVEDDDKENDDNKEDDSIKERNVSTCQQQQLCLSGSRKR